MEITMRRVSELTPYEKNAKQHDQKQIANVANSIRRFGWQQPIVVDENGVVVIGHCRLLAAKKLGMKEVPRPDDAADALALAICHSRAATSLLNTERVFDPSKYDTR